MCLSRFFGQPGSKLDLLSSVHMFCWLANSIMPLTFHARPYYNIVFIIRETEKVFNDRMRHQASTRPTPIIRGALNIIEADREPHAPKATGERSIYIYIYIYKYYNTVFPNFIVV